MIDFGLTDSYRVHDGLDQGKIFFLLLWHIFYDPLLCEVKWQKSVCEYKINSHFISKGSCTKFQAGIFSLFTTGTFIDDTIWVGSSQNTIQHILNVASEFFQINDISINNEKTVAIPINSRISNLSFFISGSSIFIAKKGESHWYLGIFFSIEDLSKSSLAKMHSDIHFFTNLVLKKAVLDKQFLYLMSTVFHPIVNYRIQFSFVPVDMYNKWDALICKGLKLKSGLLLNFSGNTIHHSFFYGLKFFLQVQSKSKIALLVSFVNSNGVLGYLFSHPSYDLQVWCWCPVYPLVFPVCTHICVFNNFLADMIHILLDCNLSLSGFMASFFWFYGGMPMSAFKLPAAFLNNATFSLAHFLALCDVSPLNILESSDFVSVCNCFLHVDTGVLSVYMNGSLKNLGTVSCKTGAATFFKDIGLGLGVGVLGLMFSTLAELQTIVLALKCILLSSTIYLFLDSQFALDAYKLELGLVCSDFCN
ncbi:hypothetical protein G9A89_013272 [Geosiphon pyriformis]|nr:hypothetical protein G9A89_013272 [Geosiphon pyriformis]